MPRRPNSIALVQSNKLARSGVVILNQNQVAKFLTYLNSNATTLMIEYHNKGIIIKYKLKKLKSKYNVRQREYGSNKLPSNQSQP